MKKNEFVAVLREAIISGLKEAAYFHGTSTDFPTLKLNQRKILWLAYEPETGEAYADWSSGYGRSGKTKFLWNIEFSPNTKLINLEDLANPIVRRIKNEIDAYWQGKGYPSITDEEWVEKYSKYTTLETYSWILPFLRRKKIDGVIVNDVIGTSSDAHKSLALLNLKMIVNATRQTIA